MHPILQSELFSNMQALTRKLLSAKTKEKLLINLFIMYGYIDESLMTTDETSHQLLNSKFQIKKLKNFIFPDLSMDNIKVNCIC